MKNCEQMPNLSVFEHGVSVHNYFIDLYNHIAFSTPLKYDWKLPEWILEPSLWDNLEDLNVIKNYHIFHDCGKPYCLSTDEDGKRHFPNHAQYSSQIWRSISKSDLEADLMLHDMDIHLLKSDSVNNFCELPYAATLLITGLSELHSNAAMFGGISSTSFKIKWKSINKFGKRISQHIKEGGDIN